MLNIVFNKILQGSSNHVTTLNITFSGKSMEMVDMVAEIEINTETFVTLVTLKPFIGVFFSNVIIKLAFIRKFLLAVVAMEWSFTSVCTNVFD